MGWTSLPGRPGESRRQFLRRAAQLRAGATWLAEDGQTQFLVRRLAVDRGGAYLLVQGTQVLTGKSWETALLVAMELREGQHFYRVMHETDNPDLIHVPEKMLRALSPLADLPCTDEERAQAQAWRTRCERLLRYKRLLQPGVRFRFLSQAPVFSGGEVTTFEVENPVARIFFGWPGTSRMFRCCLPLSWLDDADIEVLPAPGSQA